MFSDYISEIPCFEMCFVFQSPSLPAIHNLLVCVKPEWISSSGLGSEMKILSNCELGNWDLFDSLNICIGLHVPTFHESKNGLPGQNDDAQGSELFVNMLSELGDGAWPPAPITYGNCVQAPYMC